MIEVKEKQQTSLKEPELKRSLEQFDDIILHLPDETRYVVEVKNFLITFLKTKTKETTLPINDVMAILKRKKPTIYAGLKQMYKNNMIIYMLTNIDTSFEVAYRRLNNLKQRLGIVKRY